MDVNEYAAEPTPAATPTNKVNGDARRFVDPPDDACSPDNFRVTEEDFARQVTVTRTQSRISMQRPEGGDYVRVCGAEYQIPRTHALKVKHSGTKDEWFLLHKDVVPVLRDDVAFRSMVKSVALFLAIDRANVLRFWPVRIGVADEAANSEMRAAVLAQSTWIRVWWDDAEATFQTKPAEGDIIEPIWPEEPFSAIIARLGDRLVTTVDHPKILALRGVE